LQTQFLLAQISPFKDFLTMNLQPIFDLVVSVVGAVAVGIVPVVLPKILSLLKVNLDAAHTQALETSIANGIGTALSMGQDAGDKHLSNVVIKQAAIAKAVTYVQTFAPEAMAYFNLTPASIAVKVEAALATKLHDTGTAPPADPVKAEATAAMLTKITPVSASYDPNKAMTATV
jgi:hypothetical protein